MLWLSITLVTALAVAAGVAIFALAGQRSTLQARLAAVEVDREELRADLARLGRTGGRELNAILEAMGEGVLVIDADKRVVLANPAVRDLLSLPPGTTDAGPALADVVRLPSVHALASRALGGQRQSEELLLTDGRPVLVRTAPVEGTGAVLVFHNLEDLRRLEAVRRDFVANVSHELRTPLAAIRGYAETLVEGGLGDPARALEFATVIHRHAERLARLIDDLLELSRLEAGRRPLARQPIPIAEAAERALELVQAKAAERRVEVASAVPPEALAVRGDEDAVVQVLVNLLDNAVKYTAEGGHVRLEAALGSTGLVRVSVKDDGPGIEPQHQGRVFERFYRVDAGRSRETGGTGLGLAIVKHVTAAHGG
ncbi:MAG TPA: ATP-binding protein, partial [Myxococcales bacterium]|nr:ATP-binding protein [Myxococcales bacterium]